MRALWLGLLAILLLSTGQAKAWDFYLGAEAGPGFGRSTWSTKFNEHSYDTAGFLIGPYAQIRHNIQNSAFVGFSGSAYFGSVSGRLDHSISGNYRFGMNFDGQVGVQVAPNFAVYAFGGPTFVHAEMTHGIHTDRQWMTGWSVGGAVEHKLASSWILGGRVRYSEYAEKEFDVGYKANVKWQGTTASVYVGYPLTGGQ